MDIEKNIGPELIEGLEDRKNFPSLENSEFLVSGLDYKVFVLEDDSGKKWVYKEPSDVDLGDNPKTQEEIAKLTSPEGISQAMEEQKILKEIFGDRYFLENHYTYGKNISGEESILLFQEFVDGKTLKELVKEGASLEELVSANREQFLDLWGSSLKAFQEFGIPIDIHDGNFIMDSKTGNIYLLDWGRPNLERDRFQRSSEVLSESDEERVAGVFKRIEKMAEIEKYLNLTEEEKKQTYDRHGISGEILKDRFEWISSIRNEREEAKVEKKRKEINDFLMPLFGDGPEITGNVILEAIRRFLEEHNIAEIPEETQGTIERLSALGSKSGDMEHWVNLLVE